MPDILSAREGHRADRRRGTISPSSGGTHPDGMSPDLCVGFFLRSFFVTLLYLVQVVGLPAEPVPVMLAAAPRSLDPPPKHAPLS